MKIASREGNKMVLVSEREEEVVAALTEFCRNEGINSAVFRAIGAVKDTTLAYYDLNVREYKSRYFALTHELVSCTGNVAQKSDDSIFVHAHGVISDLFMNTRGGHIMQMTTAVTCEIFLEVMPELRRAPDEFSRLELLS